MDVLTNCALATQDRIHPAMISSVDNKQVSKITFTIAFVLAASLENNKIAVSLTLQFELYLVEHIHSLFLLKSRCLLPCQFLRLLMHITP